MGAVESVMVFALVCCQIGRVRRLNRFHRLQKLGRTLIVMSPRERLNRSFVGGVAHGETEMPRLVLTWRTRKEPNQQQVAAVALIARCFDSNGELASQTETFHLQ